DAAGDRCLDRVLHAAHVIARIAFVRVDDVDAEPVPALHVDAARTVLVVAGDDEASTLADQIAGDVERPLCADAFDDALGAAAVGQLVDVPRDLVAIVHRNRDVRAACD